MGSSEFWDKGYIYDDEIWLFEQRLQNTILGWRRQIWSTASVPAWNVACWNIGCNSNFGFSPILNSGPWILSLFIMNALDGVAYIAPEYLTLRLHFNFLPPTITILTANHTNNIPYRKKTISGELKLRFLLLSTKFQSIQVLELGYK